MKIEFKYQKMQQNHIKNMKKNQMMTISIPYQNLQWLFKIQTFKFLTSGTKKFKSIKTIQGKISQINMTFINQDLMIRFNKKYQMI